MRAEQLAAEFVPFAPIQTFSDHTFEPAEDGMMAKILGVYDLNNELIDLVSWVPERPGRWWSRLRAVDILGQHELRRAWWEKRPVLMVHTPADWLDASGHAVCIVDWGCDLRAALDEARGVICASPDLERKLRDTLAAQSRPPFTIRSTWSIAA